MPEKMKCARCGKRFRQANRKQVFCADCLAKERQAKKNAAPAGQASGSLRPSGAQAAAIPIVHTTPPPEAPIFGARAREAERRIQTTERSTPPAHTQPGPETPEKVVAPAPQQSAHDTASKQAKQAKLAPKSPPSQTERRQRPPRLAPFQLTDEMRATIEQRYLELAKPVEFDGIRTQIAGELGVPKPIVKQVIQELRASKQLPSWWELQAYKGSDEELERVRERYMPLLPVPPVGAHKQIASELQMDPPQVYQAIRRLRAEMRLPQYNPPETHVGETRDATKATKTTEAPVTASASAKQE